MAIVKAIFSIVRPGTSGKTIEIKPGSQFSSVEPELGELLRMKAVSVVSEDKVEAMQVTEDEKLALQVEAKDTAEKPAKGGKAKVAAAEKSDLV